MDRFYIFEQGFGDRYPVVYVIDRRQAEHCKKLGLLGCPCVKSFKGRVGYARAVKLAASLNGAK